MGWSGRRTDRRNDCVKMLNRLRHAFWAQRYLGARWLAFRLGHAVRLRLGCLRRQTPLMQWDNRPFETCLSAVALADPEAYLFYRRQRAPHFFFAPTNRASYAPLFRQWDNCEVTPVAIADDILAGRFRYFSHAVIESGFSPDWHSNPLTGQRIAPDRHWSEISDFGQGDIKVVWETSRFDFTYALVRAYWRTGDERYAEAFWRLVESWRAANPPNYGANWKCGQEISFRIMAWCFGLYGFLESPTTTPQRVADLAQMIAISGERILANLAYALSQKNNHGISEAMGLWTIGLLFPEFKCAAQWAEVGRNALEAQAKELIYDDGAFSQHSVNYHRLMLHDYLWALRLGDLNGRPLSLELRKRIKWATDLLYQIQDEASGGVPNYGQNDGALILPLDNCDYRDYRPVLQAAYYLHEGCRCYESGPWDEPLLWLYGPEALSAPVQKPARRNLAAPIGGYYTLRSPHGFVFTRCGAFRHRPAQADLLHVDLWWQGRNIAIDPGTYSYNMPPPWDNSLAKTVYHNTVTVDGREQMDQASRFLWVPWVRGSVRCSCTSTCGRLAYWEGEHDGYRRLSTPVSYRRGILQLDDGWWLVLDRLESEKIHIYRLHWLLANAPYQWDESHGCLTLDYSSFSYYVRLHGAPECLNHSLVQADENSPRGWCAPYYFGREPALSVDATLCASNATLLTLFGPTVGDVEVISSGVRVHTQTWVADLILGQARDEPLVTHAAITGATQDYSGELKCISC